MPIYEYQAKDEAASCAYCVEPFEYMQRMADAPLAKCLKCGAPVGRVFSVPALGASKSNLDRRAKEAGFTKLQRLGKGEYEKKF